ncbi:thioredoxin fold domain-containing protein [Candidatus Woesearchaeota archaeon]|nr:thioredoxin fold domain-containing protein [Candidatus Woesearchaeota archaeon]
MDLRNITKAFVGYGLLTAFGTYFILDKFDNPKKSVNKVEIAEEVERKKEAAKEDYFEFLRTRQDGADVFKYKIEGEKNLDEIAIKFNQVDSLAFGDKYAEVSSTNLVHSDGKSYIEDLDDKNSIYLLARKSESVIVTKKLNSENGQFFAILTNNDDLEERHIKNIKIAYKLLRSKKIDPCNLYVVSGPNQNTECKLDFPVNQAPAKQGILNAIQSIKERATSKDSLLVYITGHGSKGEIKFENENGLSYAKFRRLIEELNLNLVIAFSDQCYGGGIVKEFKKSEHRTISFSPTYTEDLTQCHLFTPNLWEILGHNLFDINKDSKTSVKEAFILAYGIYKTAIRNPNIISKPPSRERLSELSKNLISRETTVNLLEDSEIEYDGLIATTGNIEDTTIDGKILGNKNKNSLVLELDYNNYETNVLNSKLPVIVDIYTKWCTFCKVLGKDLPKIASKYDSKVKFTKIDYESERAAEIIKSHTKEVVNGFPRILFVKDKQIIYAQDGYSESADLEAKIKEEFGL